MKLIRFETNGKHYTGILDHDQIRVDEQVFHLNDVKILPPCVPSKAVCVGLNYSDHAREMKLTLPKEPVVFLKPPTTVIAHNESIIYPKMSNRVDYECELAVIIKKAAKNISQEEARDYILGYTCANDVTARDLQKPDGQWSICKSFDTFLPLGPVIETDLDPQHLEIKTYVNGVLKQHSHTKNLIFDVYYLVSYISQVMTLLPGDVILTGTPSGIGPVVKGDEVVIEIENIGILTNTIQ
ncbi:fumarylacetoacetate hydrolase family protein [Cellulosilyticum sp. I15G10I2]|uniref:fumarylacetoacetate hydrolase family protein n=1 Tax=Cellulosilyticum sp. I15G10I2 TaxID=1892843 RepID=UPI00085BCD55|nr:fumarylacetoacetate hydrolase family protein [Cellulosilyticum sp. I15G10I2]